ncbi:MAG: CPA2 family monovalent cation:H+ antiporter-2, partial [Myxococcota bacterium]
MNPHTLIAPFAAGDADIGILFMELGAALIVLGILARAAGRFGLSPVPFYLLFGVLLGGTDALPIELSRDFIEVGAEIGVILLLFMIGLEYTADELRSSLTEGLPSGFLDLVLNMTPGVVAGLLLGWSPVAALLLGGVTYISSSGIIAKV